MLGQDIYALLISHSFLLNLKKYIVLLPIARTAAITVTAYASGMTKTYILSSRIQG